jgi:hypothetical protein
MSTQDQGPLNEGQLQFRTLPLFFNSGVVPLEVDLQKNAFMLAGNGGNRVFWTYSSIF